MEIGDKELNQIYKHLRRCRFCKRVYGFDSKADNGVCPKCRTSEDYSREKRQRNKY